MFWNLFSHRRLHLWATNADHNSRKSDADSSAGVEGWSPGTQEGDCQGYRLDILTGHLIINQSVHLQTGATLGWPPAPVVPSDPQDLGPHMSCWRTRWLVWGSGCWWQWPVNLILLSGILALARGTCSSSSDSVWIKGKIMCLIFAVWYPDETCPLVFDIIIV